MAESTAMTVDFLRARLLSERSVSRASKERAEQLAMRVAELEEQVRAVTAQRRQAERAAAEVLAILESHGFCGHLSDADHDGEEEEEEPRDDESGGDAAARSHREEREREHEHEHEPAPAQGEAEDALSRTTQPGAGGLSWKGRSVSPRKARQLKQRHRQSYFYFLASDSSPKYRMGQSCRKNKRKELRSAAPEDEAGTGIVAEAQSEKGRREGSDCTDDGRADLDSEVGGDERSSGDGNGGQYVIRCEKDGEMAMVLDRQAELIGQYEAEEKAQRDWEKQFNDHRDRDSFMDDALVANKVYRLENGQENSNSRAKLADQEANYEVQEKSTDKNLHVEQREAGEEHGHGCARTIACSAQGGSSNGAVTRQNQDQGDENSDGCSSYNTNPLSSRHRAIKAPSESSPSSDTLISKFSDWSPSSDTDDQLDTRSYGQASNSVDVGSVLEALQRAKMSLMQKLSRPVPLPPSQVTLALPAPGDEYRTEDDSPVDDDSNSYGKEEFSSSSPARQEILSLPAPEDYRYHDRERVHFSGDGTDASLAEKPSSSSPPRQEILALPAPGDDCPGVTEDDMKIPVRPPGLFRLPTDSFPRDEMLSGSNAYDSGFSLRETARHSALSISNPAAHVKVAPSVRGDDPGVFAKQCYDPQGSVLLSVPTSSARCNTPSSGASFLSGIPGLTEDLRSGCCKVVTRRLFVGVESARSSAF